MSQPLIHSSARVLEFDALRELLRGYASSPLGQAKITALAPSLDSAWIGEQQELAGELRAFGRVGGRFDFSGLLDITKLIEKSRIGGAVLEPPISGMLCWWWTARRNGARLRCTLQRTCGRTGGAPGRSRKPYPTSPSSCDFSATKFSPMGRWKIVLPPNWRGFAARLKGSAAAFRNRCADICANWPRAALCRTSW